MAEIAFEDLCQMALIGKSTRYSDMRRREVRLSQQPLRLRDALAHDKLMRAFSRCLTEQTGEMIGAESTLLCQSLQREVFV